MRFRWNQCLALAVLSFGFTAMGAAGPKADSPHWVGSWAASQQIPEPQNSLPQEELRNTTLRQIIHLSIGGSTLRLHLSNAFGTAPLTIDSVHIARAISPASDQIDVTTDRALTFSGNGNVTIPAGAEYISDPVEFPVAPLSDLAITLHLTAPPAGETGHPGSRATSYISRGDDVAASTLPNPIKIDHWYQIAGVDVTSPPNAASVVILGDSITDGHTTAPNSNTRWTDVLAQRLQSNPATHAIGVLNQGIGGNHLLIDGLGPNALARFDRDVLVQAGVRYLIVLEGVNDLGGLTRLGEVPAAQHAALVKQILGAYRQIILRAHAVGLQVIGGTIMPYAGSDYYHLTPADEADRQAVNRWIRSPGHFDAVIDFDSVMQDPAHPDRLLPKYNSGDHLHPSVIGYRAMADAVPLSFFMQ